MGFQRTDDFRTRTQLYLDLQTIQLIVMLPFRPDQTSPPAVRMSLDRFIVSDDAARRRSQQMSSNSQSQEFRSQATTQVFSSLGSSLNESQNSSGLSRYEEIVASGRHLETKDSLEAIRQNVMGLTTMFTSIHKKVDENSEQMKQLLSAIKIINTRQDGHDTALQDIHDTLKALKEQLGAGNIHIPFDLHLAEDGDAGTGTECGGTISPISDDGISLKDYLSSKRQRTSVPTSPSFLQSAGHERADKSVSSHESSDRKRSWRRMQQKSLQPHQHLVLATSTYTSSSRSAHYPYAGDEEAEKDDEDQQHRSESTGVLFEDM